ncbi:MAG: glutamine-hydrolyzing carbamoyl-phosphate synthase small subunit [Planctomycetota bacterium]
MEARARLALQDGSVWKGVPFGATDGSTTVAGEVVFNTAMTGYQEALTDPSYAGQILTMTAAQVGNTGFNDEDLESDRVHPRAFVVRELARKHSSFRATGSLSEFLTRHGVLGIEQVDTRALTARLRSAGAMPGVVSDDNSLEDHELVEIARATAGMAGQDLLAEVRRPVSVDLATPAWGGGLTPWTPPPEVVVEADVLAIDCGAKENILRHLSHRGLRVRLIAHDTPGAEALRFIESREVAGLFVSNGPGDPAAVEPTVELLRVVLEGAPADFPIFGICMGHQLLSRAFGGRTFKLPFGHRGANHPVLDRQTGRVSITSQNHGFAVEAESLPGDVVEVTHVHLNDGSVAGLAARERPIFSVQHHPEASPGPHDASGLFDRFAMSVQAFVSGITIS